MKKGKVLVLLLAIFAATACKNAQENIIVNEYFFEYPSIAKNFSFMMEEKRKEMYDAQDDNKKYLALRHELLEIEIEFKKALGEYIENNDFTNTELPFDVKRESRFSVEKVIVSSVGKASITLKVFAQAKKDMKQTMDSPANFIPTCLIFVDADGNKLDIQEKSFSLMLADAKLFDTRPVTKGSKLLATIGIDNISEVKYLEKFAKVVFLDENECKPDFNTF